MSKARGLADLGNVYSDGALSNRNLIINGGFDVWQRGTSFSPNPVRFGADRFAAYNAGASAGDYARSTDTPAGQGFTYSGYFNGADIRHSIELPVAGERGVFIDGSQWTLSFWVKAGASGTSTVNLGWADGVSASSLTYWGSAKNYSYSTAWEKKTITFTVGGSITGAHAAVLLYIDAVAGLYITGVQLEVGDTATPFEHRSYGQELALCQRYFEKNFNVFDAPVAGLALPDRVSGMAYAGSAYGFNLNFSVTKRGLPTMVYYRGDTTGIASSGTVCRYTGSVWVEEAISGAGRQSTQFIAQDVSTSGLTVGYTYLVQVGFTADAEL